MVYAAQTPALACLETFVHLNAGGLALNRYLVTIEIPDDVWNRARIVTPQDLGVGWDAQPAGRVSVAFGNQWAMSRSSALLILPSAIVPEESNVLVNPAHPHHRAQASKMAVGSFHDEAMICKPVAPMPQLAKSNRRGLVIQTSSHHNFAALHDIW
jgi:RES domain-containing protein